MTRRRVHEGCGIENPFSSLLLWALWAASQLITWPVLLLMHTWWAFAAYLPWLAAVALSIRWERVHSPAKMYRTWRP